MYAKMVLTSGCTLTQLRNDLVGLLTGTISAASGLVSSVVASSEVVKTVNPEWTFVQDLANTATRQHFVLSGVDAGGAVKTLGCILTDTSGVLGVLFWGCGAWDSVNKRPAAIDVTGHTLAFGTTAANFAAGAAKNVINVLGVSSGALAGPTAIAGAIYNTGAMQLQVASIQGNTLIALHYSTNHLIVLDALDLPRTVMGSRLSFANWPWALVNWRSNHPVQADATTPIGPFLTGASSTINGLTIGANATGTFSAPLTTEMANIGYSPSQAVPVGGQAMNKITRDAASVVPWVRDKAGGAVWIANELECYPGVPGAMARFPAKKRISSMITAAGGTAAAFLPYLDEIKVGADSYVSVGGMVASGHMSPAVYKG